MSQRILIVDDDPGVLSALTMLLRTEGFTPISARSPDQALATLHELDVNLVLMDLNYSQDTTSGEEGLKLITAIRQSDELMPIVVMTGWGTIEVAVDTMKCGGNDFVQKPWENDRLLTIISNQLQLAKIRKNSEKLSAQNQLLRKEVGPPTDIIAVSVATKKVLDTIVKVAQSDANILLTGENGTGKSMFARFLHDVSDRKSESQITVNMGAVTEALFESEMFGHVKGAFTDAKSSRIGRFELADGGTLFLDEIANTPYSQQGKLLRVLEDRQFEKVGSGKTQTANVRLVTATNADLEAAVNEGNFRKDLLYRINTIEIEIPPLRHRIEDIVPLAESFLERAAKKYGCAVLSIDGEAQAALRNYHWPGNVRELGHVMERAHILSRSNNSVKVEDLGVVGQPAAAQTIRELRAVETLGSLKQLEAEAVSARLAHYDGDALKAAQSLGLSRSAFYRKLQKAKK